MFPRARDEGAAARIQRAWRQKAARTRAHGARARRAQRQLRTEADEDAGEAAAVVQAFCRSRRSVGAVVARAQRAANEGKRRAATSIQAGWRGLHTRREQTWVRQEQRYAATKITAQFKAQQQRAVHRRKLQGRQARCVILQRLGRGASARAAVCTVRTAARKNVCLAAAATLARTLRAGAARLQLLVARLRRDAGTRTIQRWYRGCRARRACGRKLGARRDAARTIQGCWRGRFLREKLAARRAEWRARVRVENEVFSAFQKLLEEEVAWERRTRAVLLDMADDGAVAIAQRHSDAAARGGTPSAGADDYSDSFATEQERAWHRQHKKLLVAHDAARQGVEDAAAAAMQEVCESEASAWDCIAAAVKECLVKVRLAKGQRLWNEEQARKAEEARREAEERERGMTVYERKRLLWRERFVANRKRAEELELQERLRRQKLSARDKCEEFKARYVAKRLTRARAAGALHAGPTLSPQHSASRASRLQPADAQGFSNTSPLPVLNTSPLSDSFEPLVATVPPPAFLRSIGYDAPPLVPLRTFAEDWIQKEPRPASPARAATAHGRRVRFPPAATAKSRLQAVVPLLAVGSPSLAEVDLSHAKMTDVHLHSLLTALRLNATCTALNLNGNDFGDLAVKELADVLGTHPTLCYVSLRGNTMSDVSIHALVGAARRNRCLRSVDVLDNVKVSEAAMADLTAALAVNAKISGGMSVGSKRRSVAWHHQPAFSRTC
ncbi:hypothetical protein DIPPA_24096 [Diplonema papillatum]|nr:hypothetical protein DIPPA_24096 [Diplonema papillatum]